MDINASSLSDAPALSLLSSISVLCNLTHRRNCTDSSLARHLVHVVALNNTTSVNVRINQGHVKRVGTNTLTSFTFFSVPISASSPTNVRRALRALIGRNTNAGQTAIVSKHRTCGGT